MTCLDVKHLNDFCRVTQTLVFWSIRHVENQQQETIKHYLISTC